WCQVAASRPVAHHRATTARGCFELNSMIQAVNAATKPTMPSVRGTPVYRSATSPTVAATANGTSGACQIRSRNGGGRGVSPAGMGASFAFPLAQHAGGSQSACLSYKDNGRGYRRQEKAVEFPSSAPGGGLRVPAFAHGPRGSGSVWV